jgi:hypothetical protein
MQWLVLLFAFSVRWLQMLFRFQGQNKYSEYYVTFVRNFSFRNTSIRLILLISTFVIQCLMDSQALSLLLILVSYVPTRAGNNRG